MYLSNVMLFDYLVTAEMMSMTAAASWLHYILFWWISIRASEHLFNTTVTWMMNDKKNKLEFILSVI